MLASQTVCEISTTGEEKSVVGRNCQKAKSWIWNEILNDQEKLRVVMTKMMRCRVW